MGGCPFSWLVFADVQRVQLTDVIDADEALEKANCSTLGAVSFDHLDHYGAFAPLFCFTDFVNETLCFRHGSLQF